MSKKVKTKDKKVKDLKRGDRIQLAPQVLHLLSKTKLEVPSVTGDVYRLQFVGAMGPLEGLSITLVGHVDEKMNYVLKAPPLMRILLWVREKFLWNPEFAPSAPKKA